MKWKRALGFLLILVTPCLFAASAGKVLTLRDAILLAMRFNPSIQTDELNRTTQKFALELAKWQYYDPKYTFSISRNLESSRAGGPVFTANDWTASASAKWHSPIGTDITVTPGGNKFGWNNQYNPTLGVTITQPLLKGFGVAINEADLESAYDTEAKNKLQLKESIGSEIDNVISSYISVINAKQQIVIDNETLKQNEQTLKQTRAQIKAGVQPRSDAIQYESDIANDKSTLQLAMTQLDIARYQLLDQLGLRPTANIKIDDHMPANLIKLPTLAEAEKIALKHNINYQSQIIDMRSAQRNLMVAKDNMRWGLSLSESYTAGGEKGTSGLYHGLKSHRYYDSTTSLTLTVPIDDMDSKSGLLSATVGLDTDEINLREQKRTMLIQLISTMNTIESDKNQIVLDQKAEKLAQQTLKNAIRQYQAGQLSSISVRNVQQQLVGTERSLVNAKISYFEELVSLDQTLGRTTDTWNVRIHY